MEGLNMRSFLVMVSRRAGITLASWNAGNWTKKLMSDGLNRLASLTATFAAVDATESAAGTCCLSLLQQMQVLTKVCVKSSGIDSSCSVELWKRMRSAMVWDLPASSEMPAAAIARRAAVECHVVNLPKCLSTTARTSSADLIRKISEDFGVQSIGFAGSAVSAASLGSRDSEASAASAPSSATAWTSPSSACCKATHRKRCRP
mmetsp:Transcript_65048/g.173417  ORF Transcript_65048/g.173417 Transcript_65048/m.173417 type:complete len:204 (+) Transcript_65048:1476-2087(+)